MESSENLSIITNFGCPFNCSFCISNAQKSKDNFKFEYRYIRDIEYLIKTGNIKRISLSGGGDPLNNLNSEKYKLFKKLKELSDKNDIVLSVHTNFLIIPSPVKNIFDKYVVSLHKDDYIKKIKRWSTNSLYSDLNGNVKHDDIRFVYVLSGNDVEDINMILRINKLISNLFSLTIKPLSGNKKHLHPRIKRLIEESDNILYLPSGDYNLYYNLENKKVYKKFILIPKVK